jgi:hypothetical protein
MSGGAFSTGGAPEPLDVEAYLPVTVTDYFAPSGFMGQQNGTEDLPDAVDPEDPDEIQGITMDLEGCAAEDRPAGAAGECFKVTYQPQYLTPCEVEGCAATTWAGAFFQSPALNWGEEAGTVIEQGATKIVFTAWSDSGEDLDLIFIAGGLGNLGSNYADTFKKEVDQTITGTPTQYELDLTGQNYEMVLGGFCWVVEASSLDPIVFYLDDIRWVK